MSNTPSEDRFSFEVEGQDVTEVEIEEEVAFNTETGRPMGPFA